MSVDQAQVGAQTRPASAQSNKREAPRAQDGWLALFGNAVWAIQARSLRFALVGWGFWLALAAGLLVASVLLHNTIRGAQDALLLVVAQPLRTPIHIAASFLALYVAIAAATMLGRERERGTLNVLLFGPASEGAAVLGNFLAHWWLMGAALVGTGLWALLASWALNLQIDTHLLWLLLAAWLLGAALTALALLAATAGRRARTSLLLFLGVAGFLLLILAADSIIGVVTAAGGASESLLVIDRAIGAISLLLGWVSPLALFDGAATALEEGMTSLLALRMLLQLLITIVLLVAASWNLRRKRGEA